MLLKIVLGDVDGRMSCAVNHKGKYPAFNLTGKTAILVH